MPMDLLDKIAQNIPAAFAALAAIWVLLKFIEREAIRRDAAQAADAERRDAVQAAAAERREETARQMFEALQSQGERVVGTITTALSENSEVIKENSKMLGASAEAIANSTRVADRAANIIEGCSKRINGGQK